MKRFVLMLLTTVALATSIFFLVRPGAQASPDAFITVNSTADTNTRDDWMTLREAMMLATGDLAVNDLYQPECVQVSDAFWISGRCVSSAPPGAPSADTIVFNTTVFPPGSPATITLGSPLPSLDTGDDTVDGSAAGVIVDGGTTGFGCLSIGSDNNTIKGLEIYHCGSGIEIYHGTGNTVGGSNAAERNVVSGNIRGIFVFNSGAMNNTVKGNYIGTDATGTNPMPNEYGVIVTDSQGNTIGDSTTGAGNLIAFNSAEGVSVAGTGATGNPIRGNSIHSNGGKGIENVHGGNTELAPPIVDSAVGSAMGTACPNCTIDVYSDDEDEGRVYEGSTTANGSGNWSFGGSLEGPNITATATDADGNTSEFSAPVELTEPTPTPSTPTPTPTPTATPTPGATPTPAGPTRTLQWTPGWQNGTWSGASTPEEVFACAAGKYAAAYRFVGGGLERYFPDRPDISNMNPLGQYAAFLILITQPVTCTMPVASASGATRTLQWGVGWHNEGWSGADGAAPQDAFACAMGNYAAAYRLVNGAWERYFPNRPDISNMGPLNRYDAFLILVTAPVSCTMAIAS